MKIKGKWYTKLQKQRTTKYQIVETERIPSRNFTVTPKTECKSWIYESWVWD
jgi:hypothetical protein